VSLPEISYEVAFVINSHLRHYVFEAQERSLEQLPRTFEAQGFKVLCRRQTGFALEKVAQAGRRKINGGGERFDVKVGAEIFRQQMDGLSYT
jgi:hypothetical protein